MLWKSQHSCNRNPCLESLLVLVLLLIGNERAFTEASTNNIANPPSVSTVLNWSGEKICDSGPCKADEFITDHYACSLQSDANWNGGVQPFIDPIPPGNQLLYVNVTFYGRFYCNLNQALTTFVATIDDELFAVGVLPHEPEGCNCSRCITSASYLSNSIYTAWSSYRYQQENIFQLRPIFNNICLSSVNLTFYYAPIHLIVLDVEPNNGTVDGGTLVNITVQGFNEINWCQFGDDGIVVPARSNETGLVNCTTPPVPTPRTVTVRLSIDGIYFFDSNVTFTYYDTPFPLPIAIINLLKEYWWILLIGALVIVGVVSVFGVTIKRQSSSDPIHTPLLQSGNLLTYQDVEQRGSIGPGDVILGERIGRGNFGEVFKGYWHGTVVAVKKTKIPSVATKEELAEFLEDFEREAQIMRTIRHPNVLQFLGICKLGGEEEICIITEYMPRGSLHKILHDSSVSLDWSLRFRMANDVCRGMNYLHKSNPVIIHRDLKSHNLLLDEYFKVKIGDFGLAKLLTSVQENSSMTSCGTPAWTAPEVLRNERYTELADVFSFGIVLWELVTREEPHHGVPPFQIVFAVGTQGIRPTIPSSCPPDVAILIEDCWAEEPIERPNFGEIMKRLETISVLQD